MKHLLSLVLALSLGAAALAQTPTPTPTATPTPIPAVSPKPGESVWNNYGLTVTSSGSVSSGSRKVTLIFSTDFAGTVLGVAFSGTTDSSYTFQAPAGGVNGAISYTVTAGNLRIIDTR